MTDNTDTSQNQERGYRPDKRILVKRFNGVSYGAWITAAKSGTNSQSTDGSGNITENPGTGDFVSVDPVTSTLGIAIGNPALDNDGNVYFTAATQAVIFSTGGTTVRAAIFRAAPVGGTYSVGRILSEGDVIEDPVDIIDRTVTFIPLATATSDLTSTNIQYPADNCLEPNSALRDSLGGLSAAVRLTDGSGDPTVPTRWNFLYIAYK